MPSVTLLLLAALAAPPKLIPVPALAKVRPGLPLPTLGVARLRAARGECEGLQVEVSPPAEVATADVAPMRGSGRSEVPVQVYREGWMDLTRATEGGGAAGPWPDPLIPVHRANGATNPAVLPARSTPERPLVLYLELCVPLGVEPGTYESRRSSCTWTFVARAPEGSAVPPRYAPSSESKPLQSTTRVPFGPGREGGGSTPRP